MGKTFRDEELTVVVLGEFNSKMLTVGGGTHADIDGNVENGTAHAAHQLGLGVGRTLEMETAHDTTHRLALVVLDEVDMSDFLVEVALGEGLEEIATLVVEDTRLYDE